MYSFCTTAVVVGRTRCIDTGSRRHGMKDKIKALTCIVFGSVPHREVNITPFAHFSMAKKRRQIYRRNILNTLSGIRLTHSIKFPEISVAPCPAKCDGMQLCPQFDRCHTKHDYIRQHWTMDFFVICAIYLHYYSHFLHGLKDTVHVC